MVTQARERLSDDHQIVGEVLKQLLTTLDNKDVPASFARLDLLWARLAVHIRAEHLYLFPAVTNGVSEAVAVIETLRADHNFFMHELARGIGILRELPQTIVTASDEASLTTVAGIVRAVEKRLATHNEIEENQVYLWSTTILAKPEQAELLKRINTELEKRPPRFSKDAWANDSMIE